MGNQGHKSIRRYHVGMCLFTAAIGINFSCATAQTVAASAQSSDTAKAKGIVYPTLTPREGKGLTIPLPPAGHPRLYLNKQLIPELIKKTDNPITANLWDKILESGKYKTDGLLDKQVKDNNNLRIRNAIEAKALIFALSQEQDYGKQAVSAVINYYKTLRIDPKTNNFYCRDLGRAIVTGSMVYDWCYALLSNTEKAYLISKMEEMATGMEIKWPALVQGSVVGHGTEAQIARDMLSCGIATFDEKPEIYRLAAGRIFAEFTEVRSYFYPGEFHHQGSGYGPYRYVWDMYSTLILDRMGYPQLYGKQQAKVPYQWMYTRRPDGQLLRNGDDFNENYFNFGQRWTNTWEAFAYTGSYFKDPVLMGEAQKDGMLGKGLDYIFDFLFFDPTVPANTNRDKIPLTKYFPEPFGDMVARTGWHEGNLSNDVVAEMKIVTRNFANHQHLDAGSFQLYYKGPLAVQSGIYQGQNGSYGGEHFMNYSTRTIAHNSMLIFDPNESFYKGRILNDGGQHLVNYQNEPGNLKELMLEEYATGKVLAHRLGPDTIKPEFSFIKGDLTKAYSGKVKRFNRSFLFMNLMDEKNPAALIVYDVVTSADKSFKKYWLLHSVAEPKITGNETSVKMTDRDYTGKLINTTLLPLKDDLEIVKVGGAGHEYDVFGKNFPQLPYDPEKSSADRALWRIQVSPRSQSVTNQFLNVMQVMDGGVKQLAVESITADLLIGAMIKDRIAFFSKTGDLVKQDIVLEIPGKSAKKIFISDVENGKWEVTDGSTGKPITAMVKADNEVLYFSTMPGKIILKKIK